MKNRLVPGLTAFRTVMGEILQFRSPTFTLHT